MLKFGSRGIGLAVGAALALNGIGTAAEADGHAPRPKPKPQPKKVRSTRRVLDQVFGGLMGDAFVTHIITPKPLGKRARRRLRGRIKEEKRIERTIRRNE